VNSTYNIVVGRSRSVEGPYTDNVGRDMFHGGGRMVICAGDRKTGAGHFGRTVIDEGVEVMSFHWEADFDQGGRSVLAIHPLLWRDGWPVGGDRLKEGSYAIFSERRGYSLELSVDFVRMAQERRRFFQADDNEPVVPVAEQALAEVSSAWPQDSIGVRCSDYMFRPWQHWTLTAVPEAGGYLSNPYFKITIAGTGRALAATAGRELTVVPQFTGSDAELWRVEQCTDGTFRLLPKAIPGEPGVNTRYVLYSAGDSTPTLAPWDFTTDNAKWRLKRVD
jgi:arabinan endo-1,5-alpha-L-arabinosidase